MSELEAFSEEGYFHKVDKLLQSCCTILQRIFLKRWENSSGKKWDEHSAKTSLSENLELNQVYLKIKPPQKKLLKKGQVETWDITMLAQILKQYRPHKPNKKLFKDETWALDKLASFRNQLAHSATKKFSVDIYSNLINDIRHVLSIMGVSEKEIDKIIQEAHAFIIITGPDQAKKIQQKGDDQFAHGNWQEAVKLYDEALLIPNLRPELKSILYEKRSLSHFHLAKTKKQRKDQYLDQAEMDIKIALGLNEASWEAHHIMGKICKEKQQFNDAIQYFTKALAIAPSQTEIKNELSACKFTAGNIEINDHMNPLKMPTNLAERVQIFINETAGSCPMTEDLFMETGSHLGQFITGQEHVHNGHRFEHGWRVEQNFDEAVRYFLKADKAGNSEGTYNLARLYLSGKGIQQNIPFAIKLLEKAAKMPADGLQNRMISAKMIGVYAAQHTLGLLHEFGVLDLDYKKAAYWYKKAALNGCGNAANNLAILYEEGRGVKKDLKMAELYWKFSVERKNMNAATSLFNLYMYQKEPELARLMLEKAKEFGKEIIKYIDAEHIEARLKKIEEYRDSLREKVELFEENGNISNVGLNFGERCERMVNTLAEDPEWDKFVENTKFVDSCNEQFKHKWPGRLQNLNAGEIFQKMKNGSSTAAKIWDALTKFAKFEKVWNQSWPNFSTKTSTELIECLYETYRTEYSHVANRLPNGAKELCENLFTKFGDKPSLLDKKIRLCYIAVNYKTKSFEWIIEILEETIRRYPEEEKFYDFLSGKYGSFEKYKLGLQIVREGLCRFPESISLHYHEACLLRLCDTYLNGSKIQREDVRDSYIKFIEMAPNDDRKVPEAYFAIGVTFVTFTTLNETDVKSANLYYVLGLDAETNQLSYHLPYESSSKAVLENRLLMLGEDQQFKNTISRLNFVLKNLEISSPYNRSSLMPKLEKTFLKDPNRIELIRYHRAFYADAHNLHKKQTPLIRMSISPNFRQKVPIHAEKLKKIQLRDMQPRAEKIYENRYLNLTIIENPILRAFESIHLIAQDDHGDVTRLFVYNVAHNNKVNKTLGFGCKLVVMNPYLRIGARDNKSGIRVDEPKCLVYGEKVNKMCRYCGEENAPRKCSKCKVAYCSRQCQVKDWNVFKHKLICNS